MDGRVLCVEGLYKSFGRKQVLKGISDTYNVGLHALLGPNGAGKSTYMNCICGGLKPDQGHIYFNGQCVDHMPVSYKASLRMLFQRPPLYPSYTVEDMMRYGGMLYMLDRKETERQTERLLEQVHLGQVRKKRVRELSGGMKQRLCIAQALLGNAVLLFLDEPTVGLDIEERENFKEILSELKSEHIILMSTHILSDVERLADDISVMAAGQIVGHINMEELPVSERHSAYIQQRYFELVGKHTECE